MKKQSKVSGRKVLDGIISIVLLLIIVSCQPRPEKVLIPKPADFRFEEQEIQQISKGIKMENLPLKKLYRHI